jgi:hypothetical protein
MVAPETLTLLVGVRNPEGQPLFGWKAHMDEHSPDKAEVASSNLAPTTILLV